ncbi:hypothetical protein [Ruminococcus flavefaciens]|uniref:Uncharacterized protein n=1 Tax=Ruminococcus flavefaciens TaxID=1265 RepID=A0A1K1MF89_RUMFL|nr:hypothetical protein [Ruminococcus flavefaciens]SFW21780.1 hypothetical protein SAMN02910280_1141 [Ruminococcus flavefaciens]
MEKQRNKGKKGKEKFNDIQEIFIKQIIKGIFDTTTVGLTVTYEGEFISRTAGSIAVKKDIKWFKKLFSYTFKNRNAAYLDDKPPFIRIDVFNKAIHSINDIFGISDDDNPQLYNTLSDDEMDHKGELLYQCYCLILQIIYYNLDGDEYKKDNTLDYEKIREVFSPMIKDLFDIKSMDSLLDQKKYDDSLRLANYEPSAFDDIEITDDFARKKRRLLSGNDKKIYIDNATKYMQKMEIVLSAYNSDNNTKELARRSLYEPIYFYRSTVLSLINLKDTMKEEILDLLRKCYELFFKEDPSDIQEQKRLEFAYYIEYRAYLVDNLKALSQLVEEDKHRKTHF